MVTADDIDKDLALIEAEADNGDPKSSQPRKRTVRPSILMKMNSLTESTGLVISKDDQVSFHLSTCSVQLKSMIKLSFPS